MIRPRGLTVPSSLAEEIATFVAALVVTIGGPGVDVGVGVGVGVAASIWMLSTWFWRSKPLDCPRLNNSRRARLLMLRVVPAGTGISIMMPGRFGREIRVPAILLKVSPPSELI